MYDPKHPIIKESASQRRAAKFRQRDTNKQSFHKRNKRLMAKIKIGNIFSKGLKSPQIKHHRRKSDIFSLK